MKTPGQRSRFGRSQPSIKVKDRMGFDCDVLKLISCHRDVKPITIQRRKRKSRQIKNQLDGTSFREARSKVTLPKFSWDED